MIGAGSLLGMAPWKRWCAGLLVICSAIGSFFPDAVAPAFGLSSLLIELTAALIGIAVLVWAARASRCPNCRENLLFYAMGNKGIGDWLPWLLSLRKCPKCGYSKESKSARDTHTEH